MSHWKSPEFEYECTNGCEMSGCPGHKLVLDFCRSTDIYSVLIDGKAEYYFDDNLLATIFKAYKAEETR